MKTNNMVPSVRGEVSEAAGIFRLPKEICIEFGPFEHWCANVFPERTGRTLKCTGTGSPTRPLPEREDDSAMEETKADIILIKTKEKSSGTEMPQEGYEMTVSEDGIRIAAASEQGVVWALTTLALAMDEEGNDQISCGRICDAPRYAHRGLSLDCARHFFPAEEVKKIIEEISLAKMNVLHWHLTDDQGWRIESRRFPKLCEGYLRLQDGRSVGQSEEVLHEEAVANRSVGQSAGTLSDGAVTNNTREYYTQDEIREICEYARVRGVEVIPEIDMPGHVSALLHAYPEYSCSGKKVRVAKAGGIYPIILCAGQEKIYSFLEELLEEIIPLFPGKRVHLGGDEAPKGEWKKCPYCQAKMQDMGITQWEDMQGYFMTRVAEILEKYGKTAICWNETLRASNYPQNMQVQYWTLQHRDTMEPFAKADGAWIYSDMFELYLDYPYSMTPLKKLYETVPHLGDKDVSGQENLLGLECCLWSEHITETEKLEQMLFPRTYAVAEISWSGVKNKKIPAHSQQNASSPDVTCEDDAYMEFEARLGRAIASRLHPQLAYTPSDWWNPTGSGRQQEAFAYMAAIHSGMAEEEKEQTVESTAPNEEFGRAFMTKFFQPEDLPILMGSMGQ